MNLFKQTKQDRDYLALQELLKPVEEQDEATGILSKPKKPEDEESMVTGFFSSMFDRSKQRSAELAQEMQEQQRISEEQEISDYLRRTTVSDALYDELKLPNPAYGGLKLVEDRPMTEAELEQYAPLLDLANDIMEETITVKELGAMNRMDQEAFLKSLSDLKVNERSSSFEGDTFEVASSREDFLRDLMKKREADTAKPKDDEASRLKEFLLREETDITSDDVKPVDTDTLDADGGAAPSGKGLMSPRLDGKDGDLAEYVKPFTVTEEELYNFATEAFPDNDLAAGALLATIEAESAGGDSMLESGNYTKEAALRVANQGKYKTARKKEVEKIFNNPDLTYTDSKGNIRMTKEGQVKFFNIYYSDKYRGEAYKLGNTEEGDGFRFRGRGPIQLTGKAQYKKYGDMIGVDLVQNPHLVVTDKDVALAVTKAYMKDKGLDNVTSASKLRNIVGHADDSKATKAKKRWKRAKEIENKIARSTSPRPMLRPDEDELEVASN